VTRDEHRALAERQIEESDRLFAEYARKADPASTEFRLDHARICHLRQSAMVHALLGRRDEVERYRIVP
jgi:hypothetical protein